MPEYSRKNTQVKILADLSTHFFVRKLSTHFGFGFICTWSCAIICALVNISLCEQLIRGN